MWTDMFDLLKTLCEMHAVAGFENEIREKLSIELKPFVDEVSIDPFGNLIGKKGTRGPTILLDAHIDEVGLMVESVDKYGFIHFINHAGTIDPRTLMSKRVLVQTTRGNVKGVIGIKGYHLTKAEDRTKIVDYDEMWIDIGENSKEDASMRGVRVGDAIAIEGICEKLGRDFIVGKSVDNKIGCVVLLETMKSLAREEVEMRLHCTMSVQEESVLKGAHVAALNANPAAALVYDISPASDIPGVDESKRRVKLGGGPVIKLFERSRKHPIMGIIVQQRMRDLLINTAEEQNLPYQLEVTEGISTNADVIQFAGGGVPVGVIGIPCRYSHSSSEVICLQDAIDAIKLGAASVLKMARSFGS